MGPLGWPTIKGMHESGSTELRLNPLTRTSRTMSDSTDYNNLFYSQESCTGEKLGEYYYTMGSSNLVLKSGLFFKIFMTYGVL